MSMATFTPKRARRKLGVARLTLAPHSNIATYCCKYFLLTPRNGRRKFLSPVHSPSSVLSCTSRTPSPSSSRAHSPTLWHTVTWPRPSAGSPLYPPHSSVLTVAPGFVASSTTPQTGGRSLSQVPCPRTWLARRRGGSSGSGCGTPFFPRILVRLVGLRDLIPQRRPVQAPAGGLLEAVAEVQQ